MSRSGLCTSQKSLRCGRSERELLVLLSNALNSTFRSVVLLGTRAPVVVRTHEASVIGIVGLKKNFHPVQRSDSSLSLEIERTYPVSLSRRRDMGEA